MGAERAENSGRVKCIALTPNPGLTSNQELDIEAGRHLKRLSELTKVASPAGDGSGLLWTWCAFVLNFDGISVGQKAVEIGNLILLGSTKGMGSTLYI